MTTRRPEFGYLKPLDLTHEILAENRYKYDAGSQQVYSWRSKRFLSTSIGKDGSYSVTLTIEGRKLKMHLHRLVAILYHGKPPKGKNNARHKNGVRSDNRPENIEWLSLSEIQASLFKSGARVAAQGSERGSSKLTDSKVLDIRRRVLNGETRLAMAAEYCVSHSTISKICSGLTWRHLLTPTLHT